MDIYLQDDIILKAISKTVIQEFSQVKRTFEMCYSYDLTLMALDLSSKLNVDPGFIVEGCQRHEKQTRGKDSKRRRDGQ